MAVLPFCPCRLSASQAPTRELRLQLDQREALSKPVSSQQDLRVHPTQGPHSRLQLESEVVQRGDPFGGKNCLIPAKWPPH